MKDYWKNAGHRHTWIVTVDVVADEDSPTRLTKRTEHRFSSREAAHAAVDDYLRSAASGGAKVNGQSFTVSGPIGTVSVTVSIVQWTDYIDYPISWEFDVTLWDEFDDTDDDEMGIDPMEYDDETGGNDD